MEPLNTLPCVMLPHELLHRWAMIADPEARWALVMFASSQLKYGRCRPAADEVRKHCGCGVETWERIRVAVTSELAMNEEGTYGFNFVEGARVKAEETRIMRSFVAWLRFHATWGSSVLPPMYRGMVHNLPAGRQDAMTKALLACARNVNAVGNSERFPRELADAKAMQMHGMTPPEGGGGFDGIKTGDAKALQLNRTKAGRASASSGGGGGSMSLPATQRLTPPSNRSLPSLRRGSTMFPLRSDPRGGSGGELTKVLSMPAAAAAEPLPTWALPTTEKAASMLKARVKTATMKTKSASKSVRPATAAKRSRVVKLGSKLKKRTA